MNRADLLPGRYKVHTNVTPTPLKMLQSLAEILVGGWNICNLRWDSWEILSRSDTRMIIRSYSILWAIWSSPFKVKTQRIINLWLPWSYDSHQRIYLYFFRSLLIVSISSFKSFHIYCIYLSPLFVKTWTFLVSPPFTLSRPLLTFLNLMHNPIDATIKKGVDSTLSFWKKISKSSHLDLEI